MVNECFAEAMSQILLWKVCEIVKITGSKNEDGGWQRFRRFGSFFRKWGTENQYTGIKNKASVNSW